MAVQLEFDLDEHIVTIARRGGTYTEWVGRCSCGWLMYGAHAEVVNRAATHDLFLFDLNQKPATKLQT